jgi:hypothetical protein
MNADEKVIYDALSGSADVVSEVAVYSGVPALFAEEAPTDAVLPYIVFNTVSAVPMDTMDTAGFDALIDVRCYADRTGDPLAVNRMAFAAWKALHRIRPVVDGRQIAGVEVRGGPNALPIEEHAVGRVLTAQVRSTVTA